MREFEERKLPYLFKQRHTPKVKALVKTCMRSGSGWKDAGDGWEAMVFCSTLYRGNGRA